MSIKIESMEMPETCDDCPFHVYHSHYEYVCKATPLFYPMNLANSKGIRKDWCPLSEASEPCEDTISRQAAIMGLIFSDGTKDLTCGQMAKILYVIQALPSTQPENDWIPVTKKAHPDLPIRVQVQMDNGWIITAYYQEGEWLSVPDCDEPLEDERIEAWRELPEPYKGEQE